MTKFLNKLWDFMGESAFLVLFMVVILLTEIINGTSFVGTFCMMSAWLLLGLTRIAIALENIAKNTKAT